MSNILKKISNKNFGKHFEKNARKISEKKFWKKFRKNARKS